MTSLLVRNYSMITYTAHMLFIAAKWLVSLMGQCMSKKV